MKKVFRAVIAAIAVALVMPAVGAAQPASGTTTLPASSVQATSSVLNGSFDSGGNNVQWQFQYGTSINYSSQTPVETIPANSGQVRVSFEVSGLKPNTRYHFRLLTAQQDSNSPYAGISPPGAGQDRSFVTSKAGKLVLRAKKLTVRKGVVSIPLKCSGPVDCKGKLTLSRRLRVGKHLKTVTFAAKRFSIKAGKSATLKPKLSRGTEVFIASAPQQRLGVKLNVRFSTGQPRLGAPVTLVLK